MRAAPFALAASLLLVGATAGTGDLTGRAIMELVDARDEGDRSVRDITMVLIDNRASTRKRSLRAYRMDVGADAYSIMFFLEPADVEDTGFLTLDYHDVTRDDDQWLYLPALKKTKRIAAGDKSGSFMGSDFSFADMTERNLDRYDYRRLADDQVDGQPVWVVEAIPNVPKEIEETGYTRQVLFVRQDNHVVVRAKLWLEKAGRTKYFEVRKLEEIDGTWTPTEAQMTTKKGSRTLHRTLLYSENVRFNQPMDETQFTLRRLEKGVSARAVERPKPQAASARPSG